MLNVISKIERPSLNIFVNVCIVQKEEAQIIGSKVKKLFNRRQSKRLQKFNKKNY